MKKTIFIRPVLRTQTSAIKEKNSSFLCPSNTVLTGRRHKGDENGSTQYEYATLGAFDENGKSVSGTIIVTDVTWHNWINEDKGKGFDAESGRFLVGRKHNGDEKGKTCYATAVILFNGQKVTAFNQVISSQIKESAGVWCCSNAKSFMIGRHHSGDENGKTYYNFAEASTQIEATELAPEGTIIVPDKRTTTSAIVENSSVFLCPGNCVLTGRMHSGDENGNTFYEYAPLKAITPDGKTVEGDIAVRNVSWSDYLQENEGFNFDAPFGKVIVGRMHAKDENGDTRYAVGEVFFNGHPTTIKEYHGSAPLKESAGTWFKTDDKSVMTARHHYGDENGTTYYGYGIISCDTEQAPDEPIILHVQMHSEDKCFPMDPQDYVRLSRVRRHVDGGTDYGYSKTKGTFVKGDDKTAEYYDIPLPKIKDFRLTGKEELMNLCPFDDNSKKVDELFLQPDDNLYGDSNPNKRVPVFTSRNGDNIISYWLFFGFNNITFGSHQGDWECITVELENGTNRIKKVVASSHVSNNTYSESELEIIHGEKDELTIYCAMGTHALFNKPGDHPHRVLIFNVNDHTDAKGYKWTVTDRTESLADSRLLWKYFAGAWGEIGLFSWTTGPLGAWYKSYDFWKEVQTHNNPEMKELIHDNQILLIYSWKDLTTVGETITVAEHKGKIAQASTNRMMYSRVHEGDEEENTTYKFVKLSAVSLNGGETGEITIDNLQWSDAHMQSDSKEFFIPSVNLTDTDKDSRVIVGRQHTGDENGDTKYLTGVVKYEGKKAKIMRYPAADYMFRENTGRQFIHKDNLVLVGITHEGDENGFTTYCQGYIVVD